MGALNQALTTCMGFVARSWDDELSIATRNNGSFIMFTLGFNYGMHKRLYVLCPGVHIDHTLFKPTYFRVHATSLFHTVGIIRGLVHD